MDCIESRLYTRGSQWCGIIPYHWWTASIKPRLLFSHADYAWCGLFLFSVKVSFSLALCVHNKNKKPSIWVYMLKDFSNICLSVNTLYCRQTENRNQSLNVVLLHVAKFLGIKGHWNFYSKAQFLLFWILALLKFS